MATDGLVRDDGLRLRVKVLMVTGRLILHQYPLVSPFSADADVIEEEARALLHQLLSEIYNANPMFVLNNPPVLYNRDHMVSIEWDVAGPSQNLAEVRRRIAGLNIPR